MLILFYRTYIDSPMLHQDIILADLPGDSDINQTRVRASQRYLHDADIIGVVTKCLRPETDLNTHKYLLGAFRLKRRGNVLLVATGSDVSRNEIIALRMADFL